MIKINKIGEINKTKESLGGYTIIIIEDNGKNNLVIEFQDEHKYRKKCAYKEFKNGSIKNPYHPSVYNMGYMGVGEYKSKINGINIKIEENAFIIIPISFNVSGDFENIISASVSNEFKKGEYCW